MDETRIHQTELFAWSDGRIVLFVDRGEAGPVVARGWLRDDCLSDVRRWRFDSDRRAVGQIRRLVEESTGNPLSAAAIAGQLVEWFETGTHRT
jgi:hypothetical protein